MNTHEIVKSWLQANHFDGLSLDDCGCGLDDFAPVTVARTRNVSQRGRMSSSVGSITLTPTPATSSTSPQKPPTHR